MKRDLNTIKLDTLGGWYESFSSNTHVEVGRLLTSGMRGGENRFSWEHNFWVSARAWLGVQDVDGKSHRLQSCTMLQWCQASILESKRGLELINEETPPCILRINIYCIYTYICIFIYYFLYFFIMLYIYLDDRYHVCSILFLSEPTIHRIPICHRFIRVHRAPPLFTASKCSTGTEIFERPL